MLEKAFNMNKLKHYAITRKGQAWIIKHEAGPHYTVYQLLPDGYTIEGKLPKHNVAFTATIKQPKTTSTRMIW